MIQRQISKKEFKELLEKLRLNGFKLVKNISLKRGYSIYVKSDIEVIFTGEDIPLVVRRYDDYIPYIGSINMFTGFKKIYVDQGAVKPITSGADVMAPGIKSYDSFSNGDYIVVYLKDLNVPIAIGKALVSSYEIGEKGKVVKNLHYKGDKIWIKVIELLNSRR